MPIEQTVPQWSSAPTSRTKNNVQRSVNELLDGLAPEKSISRSEEPKKAVEQHRTPTGCVLQAERAAVSVSWFAANGSDSPLGELQVLVWQGVVTRRGSPKRKEGATVVSEISLRPIEDPRNDRIWRASDNSEYSNPDLAALCNKLLGQQVAVTA